MTNGTFDPFSPSMRDALREQYNTRSERYEILEKMRRSNMISQQEYDSRKKELDTTIKQLEDIDREFHILG